MSPKVSLVCPTFNAITLLKELLPKLLHETEALPFQAEVILVDNGSTDGTAQYLDTLGDRISVLSLDRNTGFAKACNSGAESAAAPFLFFINNDILVEGDFLTPLLTCLEANSTCFAVVPRMLRFDRKTLDDGVRKAVYRQGLIDAELASENLDQMQPVVFFCGAAVLVERQRFKALGGFHTIYTPFAWEDLDIGYRAVKRGYMNLYCPAVTVYHKRETTSRAIFSARQFKSLVWRNKFIFMWSCFTSPKLLLHHVLWLPVKCLKFLCNGRWPYVWGFFRALGHLPSLIQKRREETRHLVISDQIILSGEWQKGVKFVK